MAFTRNWNEAVPTDANYGYEIDDYIRQLRVDVSDRVKDLIYGFTAGENDGVQNFKKMVYRQQSAAPTTVNADEIALYALDDGSNCGLYAKNEDGYTKQILKKVGTNLVLNLDSNDTASSLGAITVSGLTASANLDIGAYELRAQTLESDVATGTAPLTIASTTKVTNLNADKVDGYDVSAYSGAESYTFPGGLIFKHGIVTAAYPKVVTFAAAFPNSIISASATSYIAGGGCEQATIAAYSTTAISIAWLEIGSFNPSHFHWQAWGY